MITDWVYFQDYTKADIITELTKNKSNTYYDSVCLFKCVRGNVVWTVEEITRKFQDNTTESTTFIGCYILDLRKDTGWGYKKVDEADHPLYYNCPLKYLEMAPVVNQGWRDKVIKNHKDQKRTKV
jgi:hypothetical protein